MQMKQALFTDTHLGLDASIYIDIINRKYCIPQSKHLLFSGWESKD
jgi:hypothetical protein